MSSDQSQTCPLVHLDVTTLAIGNPAIFCNLADGNLGNLGNPDQLDNTLAGWREDPSTDGQHMHLLPSLTWAGAILDGRISKK